MTVLAVPEPCALGSAEAESLASVINRTARIYLVKSSRVARMCMLVSNPLVCTSSYKSLDCWLGNNSVSRALLKGLTVLSGRSDLIYASLYKLEGVVGHGRGLLASSLRICPDCVRPDLGLGYGMLCHQLQYVLRCPLHNVSLNERCLACGGLFAPYQDLLPGALCAQCHAPLWGQHRIPTTLSRYEEWRQGQVLDVLGYITSPENTDGFDGWSDLYLRALTLLANSDVRLYSHRERIRVQKLLKSAVRSSVRLPSLSTLIGLSVMQSVSLLDLIRAPVESCSSRLCRVESGNEPVRPRSSTKPEAWLLARDALLQALDSDSLLPSKKQVLSKFGLTVSGFWQRHPDLAVEYDLERRTRLNRRQALRSQAALEVAQRIVRQTVAVEEIPTIRRGGEQVRLETGASKQVAEDAMRFALRGLGVGRYCG